MNRSNPKQLPLPAVADRVAPMRRCQPDGLEWSATVVSSGLRRLPALFLLALLHFYQRFVSPALPVVTLGGCACRFTPTCSHYAVEAVRTHGALAGTWLAMRRLAKCTPLHAGGFDPVPARRRPVCRSATA